jgi:DNA-binding transcriptional LysR family regulator
MKWQSIVFDWNRTRAFWVTAEEGSFSAAAKALNMNQPTVSRQVASLEEELGIILFERLGQRLQLTQSGMELLQCAKLMGEAASQFSLVATGQSQSLEGTVVISCSELDALFRLPKMIKKLREQEPGIEIEVVVTNSVSDLKRREADIAIRSFRPTQGDLIARKVGQERIWFYGSEKYLDNFSDPISEKQLKELQVIGFGRSSEVLQQMNINGWAINKENLKIITTFQPMQLALCRQDLGIMYMPEDIGESLPNMTRAFPSMGPVMTLPVWLVSHQELRTNLRVKRVFDFLAESFCELKGSAGEEIPAKSTRG